MPGRICEISGDRLVRDLEVALEARQVEKVSAQRRRLRRVETVEKRGEFSTLERAEAG